MPPSPAVEDGATIASTRASSDQWLREIAQHLDAQSSERTARRPGRRIASLRCQQQGRVIGERPEQRPIDAAGDQTWLEQAGPALSDDESATGAIAGDLPCDLAAGGDPADIVSHDQHRQLGSPQGFSSSAAEGSRQIDNDDSMAAHRRPQHRLHLLSP
jgi:hypothetical protein